MGTDKDFQEHEKISTAKRQAQEHADYTNAIAGRFDNGRRIDHGCKSKHESEIRTKKENDKKLEIALKLNAQYAALYRSTMRAFEVTQNAVYEALTIGLERVTQAQMTLQNTLDQASRTQEGEPVFRAQDGSVYDQYGRKLDHDELIDIIWRDGAPSWEDYQQRLKTLNDEKETFSRIQGHDARMIQLHSELHDKKERPTEKRLIEISEEMKAIHDSATNAYNVSKSFEVAEPKTTIDTELNLNF